MYEVKVNNEAAELAIKRALVGTSDLSPLMADIGEILQESTKARFPKGEAPDGSKWAAKSKATLDVYQRKSNHVDIRPLFGPTGWLRSQIAFEITPNSVSVGSNQDYSAVMQFGAKKGAFGVAANGSPTPWGDIPARPYLGVSANDSSDIIAAVDEWLADLLA